MVPYVKDYRAMDWQHSTKCCAGAQCKGCCVDGTVTRGPFACMDNPFDIEEIEPVAITLECKTYAVEISVEEIEAITAIDRLSRSRD